MLVLVLMLMLNLTHSLSRGNLHVHTRYSREEPREEEHRDVPLAASKEANRARMNRDGHSSHTAPSSPVQHSYGWPRLTDTAYGAALVLVPVLRCCCWFASMCSVWLDRPPINAALEFHRHSSGRLLVAGESGGRITAPFD
ncbi:hypothetical protein J3E69DRAFT_238314 [Trichoderma sp. SZMC 28015]